MSFTKQSQNNEIVSAQAPQWFEWLVTSLNVHHYLCIGLKCIIINYLKTIRSSSPPRDVSCSVCHGNGTEEYTEEDTTDEILYLLADSHRIALSKHGLEKH